MKKAILIPANPLPNYRYGPTIGSILAHATHIEKEGKVIWGLLIPNRPTDFKHSVQKGYFYNVLDKCVTHTFDIEKIISSRKLPRHDRKFLPPARLQYFKEGLGEMFLIITSIHKLKKKHLLSEFRKISDKSKVKSLRNYSLIFDPNFPHYDKKITRQEIMNDYIADLLIRGKATEKDIEELFYYYFMQNQHLRDRQGAFKKGRLDLLFEDKHGNYIVYEIKKGVAPYSTLNQIKGYMRKCVKKYKIEKERIKGIILCKDAEPRLYSAIKSENFISIKKYYFEIGVKD